MKKEEKLEPQTVVRSMTEKGGRKLEPREKTKKVASERVCSASIN